MVQQELPLLGQRRVGRDRLAAQRGRRLGEQPRPARAPPGRSSRRRRRSGRTPRPPPRASSGRRCRSAESAFRCGLIRAISSQSAEPRNRSAAVRPWTVTAAPPAASIAWATSMALIVSRVQPRRILAVTGTGRQAAATRATICADAIGIPQQIRAALGLLGNVAHRAAEVDVDHADAKLLGQPPAHRGQRLRIVVPNLHGQRSRLVGHAPKPIGEIGRRGRRCARSPGR